MGGLRQTRVFKSLFLFPSFSLLLFSSARSLPFQILLLYKPDRIVQPDKIELLLFFSLFFFQFFSFPFLLSDFFLLVEVPQLFELQGIVFLLLLQSLDFFIQLLSLLIAPESPVVSLLLDNFFLVFQVPLQLLVHELLDFNFLFIHLYLVLVLFLDVFKYALLRAHFGVGLLFIVLLLNFGLVPFYKKGLLQLLDLLLFLLDIVLVLLKFDLPLLLEAFNLRIQFLLVHCQLTQLVLVFELLGSALEKLSQLIILDLIDQVYQNLHQLRPFDLHLCGVLLKIRVFFEEPAQFLGGVFEVLSYVFDLVLRSHKLLFVRNTRLLGPLLDQLSILLFQLLLLL